MESSLFFPPFSWEANECRSYRYSFQGEINRTNFKVKMEEEEAFNTVENNKGIRCENNKF